MAILWVPMLAKQWIVEDQWYENIPDVPAGVDYRRITQPVLDYDQQSPTYGLPLQGHVQIDVADDDRDKVTSAVDAAAVPPEDKAYADAYEAHRTVAGLGNSAAADKSQAWRAHMNQGEFGRMTDGQKAAFIDRMERARQVAPDVALKIAEDENVADVRIVTDNP